MFSGEIDGLPELLQTVTKVTAWADLPNLVLCSCSRPKA
jgi:hypothetical protein